MRDTILVVDDVNINRMIVTDIFGDDYKIIEATNGEEAILKVKEYKDNLAAMFLDIQMPVMDGRKCLSLLQQSGLLKEFPIIVVTADRNFDTEVECLNYGVHDFVKKPFNPMVVKKRLQNAIELFSYQNHLEDIVERQTKKISIQADVLRQKNDQLRDMNVKTIDLLAEVCEARSLECGTHIIRVKGYTNILLHKLVELYDYYEFTEEEMIKITYASALHDIGKIAISDTILLKPGKLTSDEFNIMKTHTTEGVRLLDNWKGLWSKEYFEYAVNICKYHHEKWDGKGYPCGLKGNQTPIYVQIVSLADCFDALTTDRVYKKAIPVEDAYNMILNGSCGAFNPEILCCFKASLQELTHLYDETRQ